MEYKTYNYSTLEEEIKTKELSLAIADVTLNPSVLVERCEYLLWDFIEEYFHKQSSLEYDIKYRWNILSAKIFSIHEQLAMASKMLEECQNYELPRKEK